MEAIILCGGQAWRLKPDTYVPKPLVKLNGETLIDYQIRWLTQRHGFERIILATDIDNLTHYSVDYAIEHERLGDGGAIRNAMKYVREPYVYVMNVDNIAFHNPKDLYKYADKGIAILLARPVSPFGVVVLEGDRVVEFKEKPMLDYWVNAGHYVINVKKVKEYLPRKGIFARDVLEKLVKMNMVRGMKYEGLWLSINTYKDLIFARRKLRLGMLR